VKEFYSERDLDEAGLFTRNHRWRLRKQGLLPPPIKLSGPNSRNLYPREVIEALKDLAGKREVASS
jgi:hypothetical protein